MKRYLLFGYDTYYPCGALGDVIGDFDPIDAIKAIIDEQKFDYYDLLDLQERCWLEANPKTGAWENGDR